MPSVLAICLSFLPAGAPAAAVTEPSAIAPVVEPPGFAVLTEPVAGAVALPPSVAVELLGFGDGEVVPAAGDDGALIVVVESTLAFFSLARSPKAIAEPLANAMRVVRIRAGAGLRIGTSWWVRGWEKRNA